MKTPVLETARLTLRPFRQEDASDILLFSFLLYCYGMPAMLKNLIDRTLPLSSMAMQKIGDRYNGGIMGGILHTTQAFERKELC